jgi:hypothetical protein
MIFSIQSYLEDYFNRRGWGDPDQYAVALARLYDRERHGKTTPAFLAAMKSIRTTFYRRNNHLDRAEFEGKLLSALDTRFKKKRLLFASTAVAERVETSGSRLVSLSRITIRKFLEEFKNTIEAEAVNSFWDSRAKGKLKKRPEKLGQELFGVFARTRLAQRGSAMREVASGIGFVDVLVTFSSGLVHVIELKMLKRKDIPGPAQLRTYMNHKRRQEGWLVFLDARNPKLKNPVPKKIKSGSGTIRTVLIEINPIPPSKQNSPVAKAN